MIRTKRSTFGVGSRHGRDRFRRARVRGEKGGGGEDCFLNIAEFMGASSIAPEDLLALDKCFPATAFGCRRTPSLGFRWLVEASRQIWRIREHDARPRDRVNIGDRNAALILLAGDAKDANAEPGCKKRVGQAGAGLLTCMPPKYDCP